MIARNVPLRRLCLICALLCTSLPVPAVEYELTATALSEQIRQRGSTTVLSELLQDQGVWNAVLLNFDSGDAAWLEVATALARSARSIPLAISPPPLAMIQMAVGEALLWRPQAVLSLPEGVFELDELCSIKGMYEWRLLTRDLALRALDRRLTSLARLPETDKRVQICRSALIRSILAVEAAMSNRLE